MRFEIPFIGSIRPELIWGVFPRLLGLVFLVSFCSLLFQIVPIAGKEGLLPIGARLQKIRDAFSPWRRWVHFPTLLWFDHSDRTLRALGWLGLAGAACMIYGGALGFWGILVCYLVYISFDKPVGLVFPWDALLFELGFLALFLPRWNALPELTASAAPAPLLVWAFRLLVFRVLFGFGKVKFAEATKEDRAYLSGFLANQPLPSPFGWYFHKAPLFVLKLSLAIMFVVEVPIPFLIFHPDLGVIAAVAIVSLMLVIQICGSFGYFSLVVIVACVALLDTQTPRSLSVSALFGPGAPIFTNVVVGLQIVGGFLAFPFNSWCGQHWFHWALWERWPRWLTFPVAFYRFMHGLRWVHPYGVFPPKTMPGLKVVPVMEVSWDGEHWQEIEYPIACTRPESRPRMISPHHARADQAVIYDTFGLNSQSLINGITLAGDPHLYNHFSGTHGLLNRILEGHYYPGTFTKDGSIDAQAPPPKLARIRCFLLKPTTLAEKRRTGCWWKRAYVGPHIPPVTHDPGFPRLFWPEPELWHFEMIVWRRWSKLSRLMQRARKGEEPMQAILADVTDLGVSDVEGFWNDFLPIVRRFDRNDWANLNLAKEELDRRFGPAQLRKFERVLGRLCVYASAKLDPLVLYRFRKPLLPVKNYGRLWLLMHDVILEGREAFENMLANPLSLVPRAEELSLERGLYLNAIFRYEAMVFEAQKLRLIQSFVISYHTPTPRRARFEQRLKRFAERVTLFVEAFDFMQDKLKGPAYDRGYPECYPEYIRTPEGVVQLKDESTVAWEPLPAASSRPDLVEQPNQLRN